MAEIKDCAFLILAGGKSSRMGKDKAGLLIHGKTFLEHTIQKAADMGFPEILISGEPDVLPEGVLREKIRYVPDVLPERGPLGGLHACFLAAEHPAAFVISVDVPLIGKSTIRNLVEAHETEGKKATLLSHSGRTEPLIGVYGAKDADTLGKLIREQPRSVFQYLNLTGWRTVELTEPVSHISNINTPEEYENFLLQFTRQHNSD